MSHDTVERKHKLDYTLERLVPHNPKARGTAVRVRFAAAYPAVGAKISVREVFKRGGLSADLRYDERRGFIKLTAPPGED